MFRNVTGSCRFARRRLRVEVAVQQYGLRSHGFSRIQNMGQHFILDDNMLQRCFGNVFVGGGHGGDNMAMEQDFLSGQDFLPAVSLVRREAPGSTLGAWRHGWQFCPRNDRLDPGRARALLVSIRRMRACAYGLRKALAMSIRGRARSAPKRARPVTLSIASTFGVRRPMTRKA